MSEDGSAAVAENDANVSSVPASASFYGFLQ
ncbi:hypothetical protein SEEK9263_22788 [Salmonella enterica subsp. enterica serovar Kentucky str. ATCC 9263]|nr:hypothetical protein SEEK9263_22788 [Salmonella enterica subsp. enterica serovar Kentucky str. ATCC 9263]